MAKRWFIDTGFVIALVSPRDGFHEVANHLSTRAETESIRLVTTDAVILEIGAALSRLSYRSAAIAIIESMRNDPRVEILPLNQALMTQAIELFTSRTDKEWSLADCVSFEAMKRLDIEDALSADAHFEQAGFRALLRAH
jgi:uncharacterized protein